ncbi:MAG: bile acid:sodium symporter [Bacteriovorax sp.]
MLKFFGLPILLAFVLGYYFPYAALALSPYAFIVLFLMMTSSALDMKWTILKKIVTYKAELLVGLFFLFLFFPLMQWFIARLLVPEKSLFYGTLLASVCPVAIVAPGFTKIHKGDEDLSFLLMIFSMFLFPLMVFFALTMTHQTMHLRPIVIDMVILIFFPLIIGEVIKWLDKKFFHQKIIAGWKRVDAEFNMLAIAFLAFIYLGASVSKINVSYTPWIELLGVLVVIFFQDFGVYFLGQLLMRALFSKERANTVTISISMKNLAVSGAILLFYDPKASLASALGFFVHALFFNFLVIKGPKT